MWGIEMSRLCLYVGLLLLGICESAGAQSLTARLTAAVPTSAAQCDAARLAALQQQAEEIDRWAAGQAWQRRTSGDDSAYRVGQIITMKAEVDRHLNNVLKLRGQIVPLVEQKDDREFARKYFAITSQLIDLSGRLRFTLRDAVNNSVNYRLATGYAGAGRAIGHAGHHAQRLCRRRRLRAVPRPISKRRFRSSSGET